MRGSQGRRKHCPSSERFRGFEYSLSLPQYHPDTLSKKPLNKVNTPAYANLQAAIPLWRALVSYELAIVVLRMLEQVQ